jgi:DMSO/TMAO reductase YedYZ molybdopterin-dependent catalytic subunit
MRVNIPTKLGFKQPKFVTEIGVTNEHTDGYWENYGYSWFAGP